MKKRLLTVESQKNFWNIFSDNQGCLFDECLYPSIKIKVVNQNQFNSIKGRQKYIPKSDACEDTIALDYLYIVRDKNGACDRGELIKNCLQQSLKIKCTSSIVPLYLLIWIKEKCAHSLLKVTIYDISPLTICKNKNTEKIPLEKEITDFLNSLYKDAASKKTDSHNNNFNKIFEKVLGKNFKKQYTDVYKEIEEGSAKLIRDVIIATAPSVHNLIKKIESTLKKSFKTNIKRSYRTKKQKQNSKPS